MFIVVTEHNSLLSKIYFKKWCEFTSEQLKIVRFHLNPEALRINIELWSLYTLGSSNMEKVNAGLKSRLEIVGVIRLSFGEDWTWDFGLGFFFTTAGSLEARQIFLCIPKFFFFGICWVLLVSSAAVTEPLEF